MIDEFITKLIEETVLATINKLNAEKGSEDKAMDTKQLAEYLNMSQAWVYKNKDIPYVKISKKKIYFKDDVDAYIKQKNEDKYSNIKISKKGKSKNKVI